MALTHARRVCVPSCLHARAGSFMSRWVINRETLAVESGMDLIQRVYRWNGSAHVQMTT